MQSQRWLSWALPVILSSSPVPAATIAWGPATTMSVDADVSTQHALDRAYLFGSNATINGVDFGNFYSQSSDTESFFNGGYQSAFAPNGAPVYPDFGNLSAAYQVLASWGRWGDNGTGSVTLNNLAPGMTYLVQAWVNDSRDYGDGGINGRNQTIGGSPSLEFNVQNGRGGVGQFATGLFTADASSQPLSISANVSAQINGLQLRASGVSPGNTALVTTPVNWSALTIGSGATLNYSLAGDFTADTAISGDGGLAKSGAGTLTLSGPQTYAGATTISGGTLKLQGRATAPVAGAARWYDASNLALSEGDAVAQWNDLSGNGANATTPTGNSNPTYVTNATGTGLGALHFTGTSAQTSQALTFTRDSSIRAVFSVFKGGSFLLTDTSAYHFHRPGDTNLADPLWASYASANILGGQTYVNGQLVNGTTYAMPTTFSNGFNLVTVLATNNVQANGFNKDRTYHAGDQYQAEVLIYDAALTEAQRLHNQAYLNDKWFGVTDAGFGDGALPATTAVTISGGGTLDLNNSDQTIGSLSSTDGLGSGVLLSAGTLTVGDSTSTTFDGAISGEGGLVKQGSGTLTLAGTNTYGGPTTISGGTLRLGDGVAANGVVAGAIANEAALVFANPADQTHAGVIRGSGTLTKTGAGTLTLSAANAYTGATVIDGGTLKADNNAALGGTAGGTTVNAGGTLDINGRNLGAEAVTLSGGKIANSGADQINALQNLVVTADSTVGGTGRWDVRGGAAGVTIDNGATLRKVDTNLVGFVGRPVANNGAVVVENGRLGFHVGSTFSGSGAYVVNSGAGLELGSYGVQIQMGNPIALNGGLLQSINASGGDPTVSGSITLSNGTASAVQTDVNLILSGAVTGSGHLTKSGGFSLILAGDNSGFTGSFSNNVSNTFFDSAAAGSASATWVVNGGNLANRVTGAPTVELGALAGTGGQVGNNVGGSDVTFSVGALGLDTIYGGSIVDSIGGGGTAALAKTGVGKLTLTGTSTYTGPTTIAGGTLAVDGVITNSSGFTVAAGAMLGGTGLVSGLTLQGGAVLSPGNSPGLITIQGDMAAGAGSTNLLEIASASLHDRVLVTGTLTLGGVVRVILVDGYDPAASAVFDLFDFAGGAPLSGYTLDLPSLSGGKSWDTSAFATDGSLAVIPEPATGALIGLGLLALVRLRHRRR